jgi:hypothetical protein
MHSVTGSTAQRIAPESDLSAQFWPQGGVTFHGFGDKREGDPALSELIVKARTEFDVDAQRELVHEAQRYHGSEDVGPQPARRRQRLHPRLACSGQPVHLVKQHVGPGCEWTHHLWMDQTKAPFA